MQSLRLSRRDRSFRSQGRAAQLTSLGRFKHENAVLSVVPDGSRLGALFSGWPGGARATRPRPAMVVIWKQDGGMVGS